MPHWCWSSCSAFAVSFDWNWWTAVFLYYIYKKLFCFFKRLWCWEIEYVPVYATVVFSKFCWGALHVPKWGRSLQGIWNDLDMSWQCLLWSILSIESCWFRGQESNLWPIPIIPHLQGSFWIFHDLLRPLASQVWSSARWCRDILKIRPWMQRAAGRAQDGNSLLAECVYCIHVRPWGTWKESGMVPWCSMQVRSSKWLGRYTVLICTEDWTVEIHLICSASVLVILGMHHTHTCLYMSSTHAHTMTQHTTETHWRLARRGVYRPG